MGDNRRTVNISTTLHLSEQSGTENSCKTLLCWFIIMIWVLVCNNMYRYDHHFESFYHNPTISETVKWANMENLFYWDTMTGNNCSTDGSLLRKNMKMECKEYFSYWPVRVKSNNVVLPWVPWLRNHLPHMPAHIRQPEQQNIINIMHIWQQCLVTISEDILTTKYGFNLR